MDEREKLEDRVTHAIEASLGELNVTDLRVEALKSGLRGEPLKQVLMAIEVGHQEERDRRVREAAETIAKAANRHGANLSVKESHDLSSVLGRLVQNFQKELQRGNATRLDLDYTPTGGVRRAVQREAERSASPKSPFLSETKEKVPIKRTLGEEFARKSMIGRELGEAIRRKQDREDLLREFSQSADRDEERGR